MAGGGNRALQLNPPNADLHISTHASDWLWSAFSVFALSLLVFVVLDFLRPRGARLFHQLATIILATFTLGYYSMASDLGATPIYVEFRGHGYDPTRQIWYVRYIQWFITFPLLVLEVLLASGLSITDILSTVFMSWVVVIMGLVGALTRSTYKWGYFSFGGAALIYIWIVLLFHGTRSAFPGGGVLRTAYIRGASLFSFLLITYPIAWACSEGGNVISNSSEMIWYGILDILVGPGFLFFFLWHLSDVNYAEFGFRSVAYTEPAAHLSEKSTPPA